MSKISERTRMRAVRSDVMYKAREQNPAARRHMSNPDPRAQGVLVDIRNNSIPDVDMTGTHTCEDFESNYPGPFRISLTDDICDDVAIPVDDSRSIFTKEQHDILESLERQSPNFSDEKRLSETLSVPMDKVNDLFQNRRAKTQQGLKRQGVAHIALDIPKVEVAEDSRLPSSYWGHFYAPESPTLKSSKCPSLTSASTASSRNSSTRSTRSFRWHGGQGISGDNREDGSIDDCPFPERSRQVSDLKANMFGSQIIYLAKCPVKTCEFHTSGFSEGSNMVRHTSTHFKGIMTCGFCLLSPVAAVSVFDRPDLFSQHLISVHGARSASLAQRKDIFNKGPNERRKQTFEVFEDRSIATCTLCSEPFDPQGFLDHLPGCVHRQVVKSEEDHRESEQSVWTLRTGSSVQESSPTDSRQGSPRRDSNDGSFWIDPVRTETAYSSDPETLEPNCIVGLPHNSAASTEPERKPNIAHRYAPENADIVELTASSRCLSLASSNTMKSSDDETDWTEDTSSPQSEPDPIRFISPLKRQLVDEIMKEFHRLFDHRGMHISDGVRKNNGDNPSGNSQACSGASYQYNGIESSSSGSSFSSRKRSLSGGGSPPPNGDKNNGDDPNKRRRPENDPSGSDSFLPVRRFACPYYKRNPGRHQTFTSCRDPGFNTVARLKEHLYRRHLLPIQCHRCCSTFPNEPTLREHQRDRQGCEVQEHVPLEGFNKDQERLLKSKKRSLKQQNEEEKWKGVYRILFPDDNDGDMPSPYIEYQVPGNPQETSNVTRFHEFSRLELPRLVRQTLEIVVEQEAQPLEEKLKERLVDIVKECQTQLFSMFQGSIVSGYADSAPSFVRASDSKHPQVRASTPPEMPFQGFDSFEDVPIPPRLPPTPPDALGFRGAAGHMQNQTDNSNIPDSMAVAPAAYDSAWSTTDFAPLTEYGIDDTYHLMNQGHYYEPYEDRAGRLEPTEWSLAHDAGTEFMEADGTQTYDSMMGMQ